MVSVSGVHYDALAESSSPDAAASSDVTQFPSSDGSKKEAALALAAEAKAVRTLCLPPCPASTASLFSAPAPPYPP